MPININQTSNAVQTRITDQLTAQSPNILRTRSNFGNRVVNLFTSKTSIANQNSQIASKLLSSLTAQVGRTIADRAVGKLLDQRNVTIFTGQELGAVIKTASEDYAKTLASFTESPLTKDFFPGGSKAPTNLAPSAHESYTTSFISHCLAQGIDLGISPGEMPKYLTDGPSAGHADLYQKLEQLSTKILPSIASHCESIGDKKFTPNPTSIGYQELGAKCMEGVAWYGKPPEEAKAIYESPTRRANKDKVDTFEFGNTKVFRFTDPTFIYSRISGFDENLRAKGFDVECRPGDKKEGIGNNKIHLSVNPDDMAKAFQVLFPLLTSSDNPFDQLKFTNNECIKPDRAEIIATNQKLSVEGETPEIRAAAADVLRMKDRVHIGNQFTFYCPSFIDPTTRKENINQQKEFVKVLEQELKKAGVRPGDLSEGHELPNLEYTTYRWESNDRIPSAKLPEDQLSRVKKSDVYQAFNA